MHKKCKPICEYLPCAVHNVLQIIIISLEHYKAKLKDMFSKRSVPNKNDKGHQQTWHWIVYGREKRKQNSCVSNNTPPWKTPICWITETRLRCQRLTTDQSETNASRSERERFNVWRGSKPQLRAGNAVSFRKIVRGVLNWWQIHHRPMPEASVEGITSVGWKMHCSWNKSSNFWFQLVN